ncbi:MAG TPA: FxsA family protein [Firmicutes bacterium]|nr:FxsA family protein [Bacillota bacterium]
MLGKLLVLFLLLPFLELYLLLVLGRQIGSLPTLALVVCTGLFGMLLARIQGFLVVRRLVLKLQAGELPGDEILNGILVLLGAVFLLTPGLVTDTAGFLLLLPGTREIARKIIRRKLQQALEEGQVWIFRR